jgi:hypothetical protein
MDITQQELKTMKSKQLRRLIKEAIKEVLSEGKADDLRLQADKLRQQALNLMKQATAEDEKDLKLQQQATKAAVTENEIDEMARLAKGFRVADPNIDTAQYANKRVSGVSLADIIEYIKANPGADKKSLQTQFNFARPQIANAVVNALLDSGVVVKLSASGEEEAPVAPGEERPETIDGPEAFLIGGGDPLAQYFDNEPNADGEEDFNDSEEPTIDDTSIEKTNAKSMSDEDYEAFMKYDELNNRLAATKSNIIKLKRNRGGSPGDLTDKPSTELVRLRDLKSSLEDRIDTLVAGSDYLKKRIEKQTGKAYVEPVVEPEEIEEEESLDEWTIRKMQHYAGIIK